MPSDRSLLEREMQRVELQPVHPGGLPQEPRAQAAEPADPRGRRRPGRDGRSGPARCSGLPVRGRARDDPRSPFLGSWVATDADGSTQTMTVEVSGDDAVEIAAHDDAASVCSGAPSTMVGTGRLEGTDELVIPSPVLTCDDGSEPEALSGPPLQDQLRDLTFVLDPEADALTDNFGGVWGREGAEDPTPDPSASGGMWPQSSLEEVRQAQERADAGDPAYTWQVDAELAPRGGVGRPRGGGDLRAVPPGGARLGGFQQVRHRGYVRGGGHVEPSCTSAVRRAGRTPCIGARLVDAPRGPRVRADDRRLPVRDGEPQPGPARAQGPLRDLGGDRKADRPAAGRAVAPPSDAEATALLGASSKLGGR